MTANPAGRSLTAALRTAGFRHDPRRHRISRTGRVDVTLPYLYLGADPTPDPTTPANLRSTPTTRGNKRVPNAHRAKRPIADSRRPELLARREPNGSAGNVRICREPLATVCHRWPVARARSVVWVPGDRLDRKSVV